MGILVIAALSFINGFPSTATVTKGTPIIVVIPTAYPSENTLQMYAFNGMTPTPLPLVTKECGNTIGSFPEQEMVYAYNVSASPASGNERAIKVFYGDEWPLTLGYGTVSPMGNANGTGEHIANPNVGDQSKRDPNSFVYFPSVYLTDITNNSVDTSGDAEHNGIPNIPTDVYGVWQAYTGNSNGRNGGGPFQRRNGNGRNIGPGADALPTNPNGIQDPSGFSGGQEDPDTMWSAEVIWKLSALKLNNQPLVAGHTYRAEFILHDGDTSHSPDVAEGCVNIQI